MNTQINSKDLNYITSYQKHNLKYFMNMIIHCERLMVLKLLTQRFPEFKFDCTSSHKSELNSVEVYRDC